MAKILLHPGIGEKFTYKKRKWTIYDLIEGVYTCKTIDDKKPALTIQFDKDTMIRICR